MQLAGVVAAGLIGVVTLFQLALAAGMPAGAAAWGGGYPGRLPVRLRVISGIAGLVVYPLMILTILETSGAIDGPESIPELGAIGMWALTGFFTVGALANLASRSKTERVWGPVSLVVAVCCAIVASGV